MTALYLFDIDGTILLAGGAGYRSINRLFIDRYGIENATEGVSAAGKTDPLIVEEILELRFGRDAHEGEVDAVIDEYVALLAEEIAVSPGFRLMPHVIECLDFLASRDDAVLGLATGNVEAGARAKLDRANLWDRFGFGGYGSDSMDRAELVAVAIERGREFAGDPVSRDRIIVVGDTPRDVAAARACGVQVIAVATGPSSREDLVAAEPDELFDTLAELPPWHTARWG